MSCQYLANGDKVCCTDRETTERTQGVWTSCDDCGHDWWCVVTERDYLDEPVAWGCSRGCDDGWSDGLFEGEGDGLGLVCVTTVAVRWIDRCDCRFANETGDES